MFQPTATTAFVSTVAVAFTSAPASASASTSIAVIVIAVAGSLAGSAAMPAVATVSPAAILDQLERNNFLVGVARTGVRLSNGSQCGQELATFLDAIVDHKFWSLKALDSFGVPPTSFSWGDFHWFPAPDMCADIDAPLRISLSEQRPPPHNFNATSPFRVRFWMVYARFKTPYYIDAKLPFENLIHVGLCVPASCHASDIFHFADAYFRQELFVTQRLFQLQMTPIDVRPLLFRWSFFAQTGTVTFIALFVLVMLLFVVAAALHSSKVRLQRQQQLHKKHQPEMLEAATASITAPVTTTTTTTTTVTALTTATTTPPAAATAMMTATAMRPHSSLAVELLLCFHIGENYRRVMRLERHENYLGVIAGLRTITCLWITVFHVYYYSLFATANAALVFAKNENFLFQPIMQACFYVDVFFVISAFLLVHNFLSNEEQMRTIRDNGWKDNLQLFGKAVLYRYLRLTPILIQTMLLNEMTFDLVNMMSPFRLDRHSGFYCKQSWWHNLLYAQNLLNMNDICCSWTWYLGCEMQFYIVLTAALFLYARAPHAAKALFLAAAMALLSISFLCYYTNNITFQIDVVYETLDRLYVKPWVRVVPYLGGAVHGWLLYRQREALTKRLAAATWCTAAFWSGCAGLSLALTFMTYWRSTPTWLVATIMSFGKLLFALAVGGAIVMCAVGAGGTFNRLLSARPFLFLHKFCYSIYMVAPVVVVATFAFRMRATVFTEIGSGLDFLAITLLSLAASFLLVLLVEVPMHRFSARLLKKKPQ